MRFWKALSELAAGLSRAMGEMGKKGSGDWGWQTTSQAITPEQFLTGSDTLDQIAAARLNRPYAQHATVFRAVRAIATSIGQLEAEVWPDAVARSGESPIEEHWVTDLLAAPGATLRGDQLIEVVVTFLELYGEAFIWHRSIARDPVNNLVRPHELWLLQPPAMKHNTDMDEIVSWELNRGKDRITIPAEEVTFLKYPNPYDRYRGLSTLASAMIEYTGDWQMALWNRSVFEKSAIPPVVFVPKGTEWLEEDRDRFTRAWDMKYGGPMNAGRAAALPMDIEVQILKTTQKEMEFLLGRRFSREQILSVFGVPPAIAGVFEFANYANSREQMKFYWHNTLLPKVRYLQTVLSADLLGRYESGFGLWFKVEGVLAEIASADFQQKAQTAQVLMGMGFVPSDINERLDMGMDTKGKPWLDEGWLPFGLAPARTMLPLEDEDEDEDEEEPEDEPQDDDTPDEGDEAPEDDGGSSEEEEPEAAGGAAPVARQLDSRELWSGLARQWGDVGRAYARRLRSWLFSLRIEVLKNVETMPHLLSLRKQLSEEQLGSLLFEAEKANLQLKTISRGAWQKAMERGASALGNETGAEITFDFLDPQVLKFFAAKENKIKDITPRILNHLRGELAQGIAEGESTRALSKRVRKVFDVERHRANTIARTETAQAFTFGRFNGMQQAGIKYHTWVNSGDTRVRDNHIAVNGKTVAVGDYFPTVKVQYPGQAEGPAKEVINCRCVTVAARVQEIPT